MATQFTYKGDALGATETTETDLGEATVPDKASRITGICAAVALETGTATEGTLGHARISYSGSGDLDGIPVAVTCMEELGGAYEPEFTPVNLPVTPLTKIKCYMTLTSAQTGSCYGLILFRFE